MDYNYVWYSSRTPNEVIQALLALTDQKKQIQPFTFWHKKKRYNELKFDLYYFDLYYFDLYYEFKAKYWILNTSWLHYKPSVLKGVIQKTPNGCKILAKERKTTFDNITFLCHIWLFGALPIAAFLIDPNIWLMFTPFTLYGVAMTRLFLSERKKYRNMKSHFELMDIAACVDYCLLTD